MRGNGVVGSSPIWHIRFQFTPLHERQQEGNNAMDGPVKFQFTPLHERQQMNLDSISREHLFQFTPLHERQLLTGPVCVS